MYDADLAAAGVGWREGVDACYAATTLLFCLNQMAGSALMIAVTSFVAAACTASSLKLLVLLPRSLLNSVTYSCCVSVALPLNLLPGHPHEHGRALPAALTPSRSSSVTCSSRSSTAQPWASRQAPCADGACAWRVHLPGHCQP
jgi:hypothetical protein